MYAAASSWPATTRKTPTSRTRARRSSVDWKLGKTKFAAKLVLELDAGVTADEVLKEAEDEAQRVENEMYVIARQLWHPMFPAKVLPVDDEKGRRETIRLVLSKRRVKSTARPTT